MGGGGGISDVLAKSWSSTQTEGGGGLSDVLATRWSSTQTDPCRLQGCVFPCIKIFRKLSLLLYLKW